MKEEKHVFTLIKDYFIPEKYCKCIEKSIFKKLFSWVAILYFSPDIFILAVIGSAIFFDMETLFSALFILFIFPFIFIFIFYRVYYFMFCNKSK